MPTSSKNTNNYNPQELYDYISVKEPVQKIPTITILKNLSVLKCLKRACSKNTNNYNPQEYRSF